MNRLETKLDLGITANPPVLFSFIKSVALEEQMEFINRRIFAKRFKALVALYNFRERLVVIENKQANAQR